MPKDTYDYFSLYSTTPMETLSKLCSILTPYTLNYLPVKVLSDIESSDDPFIYIHTLCLNTVVRFMILCTGKSFHTDIENQKTESYIAKIILSHNRNQYAARILNYEKAGRIDGHIDLICKIDGKYFTFGSSLGSNIQEYKEITHEEANILFDDPYIHYTVIGDIPNVNDLIARTETIISQNDDSLTKYYELIKK